MKVSRTDNRTYAYAVEEGGKWISINFIVSIVEQRDKGIDAKSSSFIAFNAR